MGDDEIKTRRQKRLEEQFEALVEKYGEKEARRVMAENERLREQVRREQQTKAKGGDVYGSQQGSVDAATEAGKMERGTGQMSGSSYRENKRYS